MINLRTNSQHNLSTRDADPREAIGILLENEAWLGDLAEALDARDIPWLPLHVEDAAVDIESPLAFPLVFNRVSPSSYLRDHNSAIAYTGVLLDLLREDHRHVINGGKSFAIETSKAAQHRLLRRLGVPSPRAILFNNRGTIRQALGGFPFPAILKPDCGGSGAYVRSVESETALIDLLQREVDLFPPNQLLLLQEYIEPAEPVVTRIEFVDGALVYAMAARYCNTFNLCPADSCERPPADPTAGRPDVQFTPVLDVAPEAVAQAREIVRAADLDVGGVEYLESADDVRWFIDINATSVYRAEIAAAAGVDANGMLADYLDRERRKEVSKYQYRRRSRNNGHPNSTAHGQFNGVHE